MDKHAGPDAVVFDRLQADKFSHLAPLSAFSRMISCDKTNLHHGEKHLDSFINFKIEIANNCVTKRKLDDSPEGTVSYETPAKKAVDQNTLSPDLGCFMDYCSPPVSQDSASPAAMSPSTLVAKTVKVGAVESQLQSDHVECESSTEPGSRTGPVRCSLTGEVLNAAFVFDGDVDGILCLTPREACVKDEQREEDDKGYFSSSYLKDCKLRETPQEAPTSLSLTCRGAEVGSQEAECRPESPSEPEKQTQAAHTRQRLSFSETDEYPVVGGLPSDAVRAPVEPLEGDVEEAWNIGPPILESSVSHNVSIQWDDVSEKSRQVSGGVNAGVREESLHECQATPSRQDLTLDTSYDVTPPLQVQVKSVVVVPCQHTSSTKETLMQQNKRPAGPSQGRGFSTARCHARNQRPGVFNMEQDWEREKRMYVHSVVRHMETSGTEGVMTELLDLMTHVAGNTGTMWQHPADLTRRNYQRRFGGVVPKMDLGEWQAKNCATHKRFANIPKIFQRCPSP